MNTVRRTTLSVFAVSFMFMLRSAETYEVRTHASISERVFDTSEHLSRYLKETGISLDDELDRPAVTPPALLGKFTNSSTARGWIAEGAIREDDFKLALAGCPQPANPPSDTDRPVNHF